MKSAVNKPIDDQIINELSAKDEILEGLIQRQGIVAVPVFENQFYSLVMSIVFQQLSYKAAQTIFDRLLDRMNHVLLPETLIDISEEEFRRLGISRQKAKYIHDICRRFIEAPQLFETLHERDDEEVVGLLCSIKGVGRWTAQMFLMFTLMRPDVFPVADIGIRKAISGLYDIPADAEIAVFETIARRWRPWRSYACHYLWHAHDN